MNNSLLSKIRWPRSLAGLRGITLAEPPERTALLRSELTLLRRSAVRFFPEPEDQALADVSDMQGVGGKHVEPKTT